VARKARVAVAVAVAEGGVAVGGTLVAEGVGVRDGVVVRPGVGVPREGRAGDARRLREAEDRRLPARGRPAPLHALPPLAGAPRPSVGLPRPGRRPPDTLDRAYPFLAQKRVAFGFPDILFGPDDAYVRLIQRQEETGADVVLGLHLIEDPRVWDMVDCDEEGRIHALVMKPASTTLTYGWCCAVWTPVFTDFLHRFLRADETKRNLDRLASKANDPSGDLAVGIVLQAAMKAGLVMQSVKFPGARYLDIGTPENLLKAVREFGGKIG